MEVSAWASKGKVSFSVTCHFGRTKFASIFSHNAGSSYFPYACWSIIPVRRPMQRINVLLKMTFNLLCQERRQLSATFSAGPRAVPADKQYCAYTCTCHEESGCPAGWEVGQQLQSDNVLCPAATVRCYSSGLCTLCAGCPKEACPTSFGRWGRFAPFFINLFCFELLIFVCLDASAHPFLWLNFVFLFIYLCHSMLLMF